ncbi:hypothetical protein [Helicobacter mehlei]|uniref:Uncharacterized protein n=1 Tax=Helicobacter mehlei TaxID=2316080 RepID=A0A553V0J1_9HELI|nr:hypothetical protein [Helicobacter mehlei]TSA85962.1 hypothetical protein FNE76_02430 [Helicobacter mehlei]
MRLVYVAFLSLVLLGFLGCMGMFLPMFFSSLSQDNQNQLDQFGDDPINGDRQSQEVLYYTRLEPPMFEDPSGHPIEQDVGLSSQDIRGTAVNGVEIQRSDLLQEVKDSEQKRKDKANTPETFHAKLNDCAKNDLFNELGAQLKIKTDEQKRCIRLQNHYFSVLNKHYATINQKKARVLILLQDLVSACNTYPEKQALLKSPFFKRLAPHINTRREKLLYKQLGNAKPLKRDGLHALLTDPKLGERFYRCQYFIHAP